MAFLKANKKTQNTRSGPERFGLFSEASLMKHPLSMLNVAVLGYGNLGRTLAHGLAPSVRSVVATERKESATPGPDGLAAAGPGLPASPSGSGRLRADDGISILHDNAGAALDSDVVFLCVKPKDLGALLQELGNSCEGKSVVSTAAGVPLAYLRARLPGARIARCMPNLCASIGESNTAVVFSKGWDKEEQEAVLALLAKLGRVQRVNEKQMAVWTAVNGSGPAFLALVVDEMAKALRASGFGKGEALSIALHTLASTAHLLAQSGEKPASFISRVTLEGGTTQAGLQAGDEQTRRAYAAMLGAAATRAEEMGREFSR